MRTISLIFIIGIVLSAQAFCSPRKLIPRHTDDEKQPMRGEVAISQLSYSCTKATEAVKTNCDNGDAVELYMSVVSVHATVTQLKTVVQTFDGQHATTHQSTVVLVFSSYFSMVNKISESEDGKRVCREQLVSINAAFLSISSVYITMGIDLRDQFPDGSVYKKDAFKKLDLSPPFPDLHSAASASPQEEPAADGQELANDGQESAHDGEQDQ
ncbi:hypothetical protein VP01_3919g4 [Puccinia sorghi]|uniref:Uncharacterized protein n=1 Tax=Puccinia sorghi TaxID=27349 RepID=A0A0L6USK3_9BASI|nr:hypothetical protein VP01_3919g4 [Puccinia sorghi]